MPKLETLARQKQIEETEKERYQAEREARWKKQQERNNPHPPKTSRVETEGEFRDRQLQAMFDKMQLTPGLDVPIPHDFFTSIPEDEKTHLGFSST